MIRPAAAARSPVKPHPHLELFQGDLRDRKSLQGIFDGVDVLVHLAAATSGDEVTQFGGSVVGTENLLAVMSESATRRIVFCSTFSVYDYASSGNTLREDSPLERDLYHRDAYPIAKSWQERVVRRAAEKNSWDIIILRPGFIWGAGNEFLACLGFGAGPLYVAYVPMAYPPLTHVDNCADCFAHAAERCGNIQGIFNVVDDYRVSSWRYLGEYIKRRAGRGIRVPFPYVFGSALAHLAQGVSRVLFKDNGKLPGILAPTRFRARFRPLRYELRRLHEELKWRSSIPFEECLARTYSANPWHHDRAETDHA
jgi:UDP-glucose 4-epimerase